MELNGNGCTMHNKVVVAVAAQFNASALHKAFAIYDISNEKLPLSLLSLQCESNEPEKGTTECKVFDGNGWMSEKLQDVVMYHFS